MIKAVIATFKQKQISALSSLRLTVVAQTYLQALSFNNKRFKKAYEFFFENSFPAPKSSHTLEAGSILVFLLVILLPPSTRERASFMTQL